MLWMILASASLLLAPAHAGPNTAMVGVSDPDDLDALREAVQAAGGQLQACYRRARFCIVALPAPPAPALLQTWAALPGVRYAEADRLMDLLPQQGTPPDAAGTTDCPDLWERAAISADGGWDAAADAPVVAVADGGFRQTHHEIQGQISGQFDYGNVDPVAELEWDVGVPAHGTFIAAIIAGNGSNGEGRAGIIPGGSLNLLKIADSSGAFYFSYAAAALADVADGDLGIGAVNYSLASSSYTDAFRDAVASLETVGVVLVAAAGNCGYAHCSDANNDAYPQYPASFTFEHVITVAGSTQGGGVNSYSHYGATSVDLAAPGVDLCSADVDSDTDYATASGTSYAAPLVAGAAGLLMGAHPDLTPTEVARVLRASASPQAAWRGKTRSGGILNIEGALLTAVPRLSIPLSPDPIDGLGTLDLVVESPGAAGTGSLLLAHGAGLSVEAVDADGWRITPYAPGDTLSLPDAGTVTMTGTGSLLTGPLEAHRTLTLRLTLAGHAVGTWPASVRLSAASLGADYLNTPYDAGSSDETGFLALPLSLQVVGVVDTPEDTSAPEDTAADSGDGGDSPARDTDEDDTPDLHPDEAEPSGCACTASPRPSLGGAWGLLAALLLTAHRRRQR